MITSLHYIESKVSLFMLTLKVSEVMLLCVFLYTLTANTVSHYFWKRKKSMLYIYTDLQKQMH